LHRARNMSTKPDLIVQFGHFLAKEYEKRGYKNIEIKADVLVSLNYRKPQYLIDPNVNLVDVKRGISHYDWIMPLKDGEVPKSYQEAEENLKN